MSVTIITGGSRGLGKDAALQIAKKGGDVILTYQTQAAAAEEVVAEIQSLGQKAAAVQLDVADSKSFDGFVETVKGLLASTFGVEKIDNLVNNAGVGLWAGFLETTEEQFDLMLNVHLKSTFFLTQKLVPLMNSGGSVVNLSTGLTRFAFTGYDAYAVMKGGVETLTKYQAKALGALGIRANSVAPGAIETDFGGGVVRDNKEMNGWLASQTALGRVGLPHDIGSVVAFLCSEDSKWVTGQRIEVSGGMLL